MIAPGTRYRTIVADPPWRYANNRGMPTASRRGRLSVTAEGNYPTMSNAEIAALPVADLADREAHCYLWVTNPRLFGERASREVTPVEILAAWGFEYVTLLTWVKTGPPGLGFYFRGHTEHVLFGVRGGLKIPPHLRESNVVVAPRRAHSQKPEAFYDLVERVSEGPRVELFARRHRLGWDVWGNESANTAAPEVAS